VTVRKLAEIYNKSKTFVYFYTSIVPTPFDRKSTRLVPLKELAHKGLFSIRFVIENVTEYD